MSAASPQYEFTNEQNQLLSSLAGKMSFVGLFALLVGLLNLLMTILVITAIYRDHIPDDWKAKSKEYWTKARQSLPEDMKKQAEQYSLDKLPSNDYLWGVAMNTGFVALFLLVMGWTTRAAAASFRRIVTTQGRDVSNLMNGLGSLHSMFSLLSLLLQLVILAGVIALGLAIYRHYMG
jgi:hypothetical protein